MEYSHDRFNYHVCKRERKIRAIDRSRMRKGLPFKRPQHSPYTKLKPQHCPFGWSCLFIESETDYLRSILLCIKILRYRVPLPSGMYGIVSTVAEDSLGLLLPFKESRGSDGGPAHLMSIPHSPFLQHPLEDT